jgi:hypothetical protein
VSTPETQIAPEPNALPLRRKRRALCPPNGSTETEQAVNPSRDDVMTPRDLAAQILRHYGFFDSSALDDTVLDPCRGTGAFYDQFPQAAKDWCELKEGRDFLTYDFGGRRFDWCVTNLPWSKFRPFLQRAMEVSDNIVFLCLVNAIFMKARLRDMEQAGFGLKEILLVPTPPASTGWPQCGFQLGCIHLQRGYVGKIALSKLEGMKL